MFNTNNRKKNTLGTVINNRARFYDLTEQKLKFTNKAIFNIFKQEFKFNEESTKNVSKQEFKFDDKDIIDISALIKLPQINKHMIVAEILLQHEYIINKIYSFSAKRIQILINYYPEYLVDKICKNCTIETVILQALVKNTHNRIFEDIEFIHNKFNDNSIWRDFYKQYYDSIVLPIIQELKKESKKLLQQALLDQTSY